MTRQQRRVRRILQIIKDANLVPNYEPSKNPELEDDSVLIGKSNTHLQICSMSGDAVMVSSQRKNPQGDLIFVTDQIDDNSQIITTIRRHLALPPIVASRM